MSPTPENIEQAKKFLLAKWQERHREMGWDKAGEPTPINLHNACKFAAVFARKVFGGKLRANYHHTWVEHPDVGVLDLTDNVDGSDYKHDPSFARRPEFHESLRWNEPRVNRWVREWQIGEKVKREESPERLAASILPTRQSLGMKPVSAPPKQETGHTYFFQNGTPIVHDHARGTVIQHTPWVPSGRDRFQRHMAALGTPEAETMRKAVESGHKWDVAPQDFNGFMDHDPHTLAAFAGAGAGDHVHFSHAEHIAPYSFRVALSGAGDNDGASSNVFVNPVQREVLIDSLHGPTNARGKGWGLRRFYDLLKASRKFGIERISVKQAAGRPGSSTFNGYYTWPRLGFDGRLENTAGHRLPPHLRDKETFHELFDHPEGAMYWKDHGADAFNLHFDTAPGSPHVKRLVKYLRAVQASRRAKG